MCASPCRSHGWQTRHLGGYYLWQIKAEEDGHSREEHPAQQREWVNARDSVCAGGGRQLTAWDSVICVYGGNACYDPFPVCCAAIQQEKQDQWVGCVFLPCVVCRDAVRPIYHRECSMWSAHLVWLYMCSAVVSLVSIHIYFILCEQWIVTEHQSWLNTNQLLQENQFKLGLNVKGYLIEFGEYLTEVPQFSSGQSRAWWVSNHWQSYSPNSNNLHVCRSHWEDQMWLMVNMCCIGCGWSIQ